MRKRSERVIEEWRWGVRRGCMNRINGGEKENIGKREYATILYDEIPCLWEDIGKKEREKKKHEGIESETREREKETQEGREDRENTEREKGQRNTR